MKRALLAAAALTLAACGSNTANIGSGQFISPTGLTVAKGADRDVIFVAGTGRNGLRALQVCEQIDNSGNITANCDSNLQFVPGPIRVFPANVETNNRPLRLAGVRLTQNGPPPDAGFSLGGTFPAALPDAGDLSAVLVVGADETMRVVDTQNLLDSVNAPLLLADGGTFAQQPQAVSLGAVAADVVADNPILVHDQDAGAPTTIDEDTVKGGDVVSAFVATVANGTTPPQLLRFDVTLDPNNRLRPVVKPNGSCTLDGVVPTRLAIAPQENPNPNVDACPAGGGPGTPGCIAVPTDDIFVGDAKGDGVVRVARASLTAAGGTCAMTRVSAGGRSVKSLALSPQWYEDTTVVVDGGINTPTFRVHPAGEILMLNLEPSATTVAGTTPDPGGILFVNMCTYDSNHDCQGFDGGTIAPIPPFRFDGTDTALRAGSDGGVNVGPEPMEPIFPLAGLPSEVTFLLPPTGASCQPPCSPVYVGAPSNTPVQNFPLVASLSNSDGATYFIDVINRRFINANFYNLETSTVALEPLLNLVPTFSPASVDLNGPFFNFENPDDGAGGIHPITGWFTPGVTHTSNWRATWHSTFPTLEQRGGTVTHSGTGTLFFDSPGDFSVIQNDPVLHFGVGDAVSFATYRLTSDTSATCQSLVTNEGQQPLRFESTIVSIGPGTTPGTTRLELEVPATANFNSGACSSFGAVAEFHTAGDKPWLVFNNFTVVQRIANGDVFVGHERRFDYPYDYNFRFISPALNFPPTRATNDSVAFHISGDDPTIPGSQFNFSVFSQNAPVFYADIAFPSGLATGLVSFSNGIYRNMLFTAVTGNDSVIMAVPEILSTDISGLQIFR
jgi:hypothetical protein